MAHATGPLVFVVLLVAGSIASATSERQKLFRLGGWRPISNPRDRKVREVAEFAVVGGRNYRLVVSAMDGSSGSPANYLALVYEKP
ncbi:UNVERIFIED_CONTAM: hypothetical protein Scaly_1270000 [Sesamum calycinum]|uniref:Cystatin domain-containing protein n=1 Tax=Sesamum calycinum TaxID=2727403 RepID=A0AAW2Q5T8_9LAMI